MTGPIVLQVLRFMWSLVTSAFLFGLVDFVFMAIDPHASEEVIQRAVQLFVLSVVIGSVEVVLWAWCARLRESSYEGFLSSG